MSVKASTQYAGLSAHTCTSGREIVRRVLVLHLKTVPAVVQKTVQQQQQQQSKVVQKPVKQQSNIIQKTVNQQSKVVRKPVKQQSKVIQKTVKQQQSYVGNYGRRALTCALVLTACFAFLGCWPLLICSVLAVVFASKVSSQQSQECK